MKQCLWSSTEDTLRLTSRREIPQVKVLILKNTIKRKKALSPLRTILQVNQLLGNRCSTARRSSNSSFSVTCMCWRLKSLIANPETIVY